MFGGRVYRPVLQILTLFQTLLSYLAFLDPASGLLNPYRFSDLVEVEFRPELKQDFLKSNSNCLLLFLSDSFGIEMTNTLIHSCSFLENHHQFQNKMGKIYTLFQTEKEQKPYPLGRHIPTWLT